MYFYIDLFYIFDVDAFRYKFFKATKFNYMDKDHKELHGKMIIIFDNADFYLNKNTTSFMSEMQNLKS